MEKTNGGLELDIITNETFENEDIKDTILGFSQNFLTLEKHLKESTDKIEDVTTGEEIEVGKIIWNQNPLVNGYVGWVNIRTGRHAPFWQPNTHYTVGQEVRPQEENGNIYECVSDGRSMVKTPIFLIDSGAEFYDASGIGWYANYNYNVNDVIFATNGSKLFYYICETAGITNTTEPIWSQVQSGSTIIDGSTVWRKEATIKWKQVSKSSEFRPFGKIE